VMIDGGTMGLRLQLSSTWHCSENMGRRIFEEAS
jgi:hypothetical protein